MYRIIKADKDAYITNKRIYSTKPTTSQSTDANTGQAGTIDIYKLYNEPSGSGIQLSRGLVHFDLDQLRALTGSVINLNDPSFKCYVSLKDVYGGQTVPSNYTLSLYPLAKNWSEGRGFDVIGYRDLDFVNWFTASSDIVDHVISYPLVEYEEAVVNVSTLLNQITIPFVNSFSSIPTVVITELSSSNNAIVNAFIDNRTSITDLYISFSAPFIGSFVYRAAYDPAPGTPKTALRSPRYVNQVTNVEFQSIIVSGSNRFSSSFADFGGTPTSAYATLYENINYNLANVYAAVTGATSTSIDGVFSAVIDAQLNLMGFRAADISQSINGWTIGGAEYCGIAGTPNLDYYNSIVLPTGYKSLEFSQSFNRGDEDLFIDVTPAISATLAGYLSDCGFRLSFTGSQETDSVTRFVKRFSTRQSRNTNKYPALVVKYDDTFFDNQAQATFDYPNKLGIYYAPYGTRTNFVYNNTPVTGSGSLILELVASASQYVTATTYSYSHQATINYTSSSWVYFSASFTGSQIQIGGINQIGSYYADVFLPKTTPGLSGVLNPNGTVELTPLWKSLDNTAVFTEGTPITFRQNVGTNTFEGQLNYATNVTNLKDIYLNTDSAKLRVFVYDFDPTLTSFYLPYKAQPKIFPSMYWQLIDPYSKEVIIPFDDIGTKLSADGDGMYFTLYMQDLPINRPLEIKFIIKEYDTTYLIDNQRFIFKVVNK